MKILYRFFIVALVCISSTTQAQNLFAVKIETCDAKQFCLDCGDEKAQVEPEKFKDMLSHLNASMNLKGIKGKVLFQVLMDSTGHACVLSHTDESNSSISRRIMLALNTFEGYIPAQTKLKKEGYNSVTLAFEIHDSQLTGGIQRVDMAAFEKSFDHPQNPEVYNKDYVYKNKHLSDYIIKAWNSSNSNLPDNWNDELVIDTQGLLWMTVKQGLVTFDGKLFTREEQNITDKGTYFGYYALACDGSNTKWVCGKDHIYSYDGQHWTMYEPKEIGVGDAYAIQYHAPTETLFFCSKDGLTLNQHGKWTTLTTANLPELPSNKVRYAQRDSKNRLWIGTYSGSVMVDEHGKALSFEASNTVLKGKCITDMEEDVDGNLYFSVYEFDRKDKKQVNNDEGLIVRAANGSMRQLTTTNSGLPFNGITDLLYDVREQVLWIATDRAGLVRYDLKSGIWEDYHNENSKLPTSYISALAMDAKGVLYVATRQGLVRLEKR